MRSTSGIKNLLFNDENKEEALVFLDNTCPKCGNKMHIIEDKVMGKNIKLRFGCCKCLFECPIYHDERDPSIIRPLYDHSSINNFFNNFGKESIQKSKEKIESVMKGL